VQLGYHWLLAPPSKNERLEFVTQSAGSHDVWRSTKTTALPRAALSPNLRQYLSAKSPWYYGAMATWWPSIQRTNRSRFDDRRSDLSVTVAEDISSAQYTLFFGGRSAMRFDTSISYLTGLTLFREDYQATARSSGAATTDILADVSHSRSYLMIPLTAEFGLSFGRFTAGIDVTIQIVAKDLSDSPKVVVSDPNFDNGDQSESAEAQLRDILGDSDQLMSASAGAYVSWRF
jgi:hypothetical protein